MAADANRPTSSLVNRFNATSRGQRGVVLADRGDHRQSGQSLGCRHQVVGAQARAHPAGLAEAPEHCGRIVVGQHPHVDAARDDAVLNVVHRVRDVVGPVHHLGLKARLLASGARPHPVGRGGVVGVEAELAMRGPAPPRVLGHRVQRGPGQVEPGAVIMGAKDFGLQPGQDAEVLRVALEAAVVGGQLVESALTVVTVWRMPDVVGQSGHVDEVRIAAKPDGHTAADLRHLKRVGQPGARRLALAWPDDLRLVRQAAQGSAVQDARPVAGEIGAVFGVGARQRAPFGGSTTRRCRSNSS